MQEVGHVPVLPEQVLALLEPRPGQTLLDCTVGRGGHAAMLIPRLEPGGRYIGLDLDPANSDYARSRLEPVAAEADVDLHIVHRGFADAPAVLADLGIDAVDGLLADLGFASNQMDDPQRGFAFSEAGPLDMRMDPTTGPTAADLVNELPERELADLIYEFGEERLSRKIARKIVESRGRSPIQHTSELADLVRRAYGGRTRQRIHPATRTFMALRIAVNDELASLDRLLEDLPTLLAQGGRAAIISFHSLEDRRVKRAFLALQQRDLGQRLTRKPMTADDQEQVANPRSRSAKLRGFQRT